MKSYQHPSFQERVGRAAEAKQKALDNLRSRPPVDEKLAAERRANREKREAAEAEKRAEKKAAAQAARESRAAAASARSEAEANAAASAAPPTDEERKRARDARYAARKNRK